MKFISSYDPDAPRPELNSQWRFRHGDRIEGLGTRESRTVPAYVVAIVTEVKWNGEEWWVRTFADVGGYKWMDLQWFWECAKPVVDEHPEPDCPRNSDDPLGTACTCDDQ